MARENFYIILELPFDPPEEDQAVINQAIERKRLEWSKESTDFKRGPVYRKYTSLLPLIREVMLDQNKRRKEAQEAYRITFERARHMLAIIEKRGFLYESEITSIAKRLQVDESIIRKACNVRIVAAVENDTLHKRPKGCDRFLVLQVYLDTLNKKDYYDFINYNGTMHKRLQDMPPYRLLELVRNRKITYAKNTPEESAVEKLCAECEKTFATEESKREYDEFLVWKYTEEIFEQVQVASELTKVLEQSQLQEALKLLTEVVGNVEKSKRLLFSYCKQNGIAIEYSSPEQNTVPVTKWQSQKKEATRESNTVPQPNMPINLKVQVDTIKRCNYITWEKTTLDSNVNYLIVRKRQMPPRNINDGELLGTVSTNTFTDGTIYPGKIYYYGVFAVKRGVYSKGITTQVGYLNLFEVQDATIHGMDNEIQIEWVQNYRECRVAIFRQQQNAPMDFGEGKLCYNASQMKFVDKDVKKEVTYFYRIFTTIYINGKRFHSKGVIVSAALKEKKVVEERKNVKVTQPLKSVAPVWPVEEKKPIAVPVLQKEKEREPLKKAPLPPMKPNPYMQKGKAATPDKCLFYDIKVRKGLFKPKGIEIIVESKEERFELPALLIVASKDYPAAYKEAGTLIGTIEKRSVNKSYTHIISMLLTKGHEYIKLFLANEADEAQYELHLKYGAIAKVTK